MNAWSETRWHFLISAWQHHAGPIGLVAPLHCRNLHAQNTDDCLCPGTRLQIAWVYANLAPILLTSIIHSKAIWVLGDRHCAQPLTEQPSICREWISHLNCSMSTSIVQPYTMRPAGLQSCCVDSVFQNSGMGGHPNLLSEPEASNEWNHIRSPYLKGSRSR